MKTASEQNFQRGYASEQRTASDGALQPSAVLNQDEAARLLHIRPRTLESWRQRRLGPPFIRYSVRCVRYRFEDLRAWLDSQSIETEKS